MRIVGGQLGGLRFKAPGGGATRPTPERVREGLASALQARGAFGGARVLDLYAGSGALGFEALSRGASRAVLVDNDRRAVRSMTEVARAFGVDDVADVLCLDLTADVKSAADRVASAFPGTFDLVFADPPYDAVDALPNLLIALRDSGVLGFDATMAIEHRTGRPPSDLSGFTSFASYRYGDTTVVLLRFPSQGENTS